MKVKQAIAQLCLKQEALNRPSYTNKKHQDLQECLAKHNATLGTFAKPIAELLSILSGLEIKPEAAKPHEMWSVVVDGNGTAYIVVASASGASYGIAVPPQADASVPASYMQVNSSFCQLLGKERQTVVTNFLGNRWKDDQIVDWVATKLGGVHIGNFIRPVFEATETL